LIPVIMYAALISVYFTFNQYLVLCLYFIVLHPLKVYHRMAQSKKHYFTAIFLAVYLTQACNGENFKERNNTYLYVKFKVNTSLQNYIIQTYWKWPIG